MRYSRRVAFVLGVLALVAVPLTAVGLSKSYYAFCSGTGQQYGINRQYLNPESGYISATTDMRGTECQSVQVGIWADHVRGVGSACSGDINFGYRSDTDGYVSIGRYRDVSLYKKNPGSYACSWHYYGDVGVGSWVKAYLYPESWFE